MFRYADITIEIRTAAAIPQKIKPPLVPDYPLERRRVDDVNAIARFVFIVSSIVLIWLQIRNYRNREK